ncbi:hypothetical protein ACF09Y_00145 [Streptomyces massasporeus]|uniref:hypothetical protein n=1 Tax=Streptomyces massasporeus TaxID=67324 RepID=UPI0036F83FEB
MALLVGLSLWRPLVPPCVRFPGADAKKEILEFIVIRPREREGRQSRTGSIRRPHPLLPSNELGGIRVGGRTVDVGLIAAGVAALLAKSAGEEFARESGRAAWERMRGLLQSVRSTLAGDARGAAVLAAADVDPQNEQALGDLAGELRQRALEDEAFASILAEIVRASHENPRTGHITVEGQAQVGKIVSMGNVQGNVTF